MPSKNVVKQFDSDSMYHVYNRGVNKMNIFNDKRDYAVFLSFLKYALLSNEVEKSLESVDVYQLSEAQRFNLRREGLANRLELVSYCLMPNHFHLLLYQYDRDAITALMRSIATGYSMYFNKRHNRIGSLFQGVYKASMIDNEAYWDHISRYIHLNPTDIGEDYKTYEYSSYSVYTGIKHQEWVKPNFALDSFSSTADYEKFVEEYLEVKEQNQEIKHMLANSRELIVQG